MQVLCITRGGNQHLVGDPAIELRFAAAQHPGYSLRRVRVRWISATQLAPPGALCRVLAGHSKQVDRTVFLEHVDRAPVGEAGHRQARQARQRRLVIERGGEHLARLGQVGSEILCQHVRTALFRRSHVSWPSSSGDTEPMRAAYSAAWVRLLTPSFSKMFETWVLTVFSPI